MSGIRWYVGIPECGKTYLALQKIAADQQVDGYPCLTFDMIGAKNFLDMPHVQTFGRPASAVVDEVVDALWVRRVSCIVGPRLSEELIEELFIACQGGRRVHVFIDEALEVAGPNWVSRELRELMKGHRHYEVTVDLTTQHFGDVSSKAISADPTFYLFRLAPGASVERASRLTGIPEEELLSLPQYEYKAHRAGFNPPQ